MGKGCGGYQREWRWARAFGRAGRKEGARGWSGKEAERAEKREREKGEGRRWAADGGPRERGGERIGECFSFFYNFV